MNLGRGVWSVCVCFRGYVCIITNVASKWGKTPVNYTQFAAMHATYAEKGLRILGFPLQPVWKAGMYRNGITVCSVLHTLFCVLNSTLCSILNRDIVWYSDSSWPDYVACLIQWVVFSLHLRSDFIFAFSSSFV